MRALWIQWKREAGAYFGAPFAFALMTFFLVVMGLSFWLLVHVLAQGAESATVISELFGSIFFWIVTLVSAPLITMRLVAEERRTGTWETLMTAPVRDRDMILAKYAGALTLWAALWAPTLLYVHILRAFSPQSAEAFDAGTIGAGYLGVLLVGAFFLSIGLLSSLLTRNQAAAAMAGFAVMCVLFFSGFLPYILHDDRSRALGVLASPVAHMMDFSRGMIDSRAVLFYLINTGLVLWFCIRVSESRKGS